MSGRRLWMVSAGALALGLGGGLAVVSAHEIEHVSAITDYTTTTTGVPGFRAQVGSGKQACIPKRAVRLIRDSDEKIMKSDDTNQRGVASLRFRNGLERATYYLRLKKNDLGSGAHKHVCSADETTPTTFQFNQRR